MLMNWRMSLDVGGARRNRTDDLFNAIEPIRHFQAVPLYLKPSRNILQLTTKPAVRGLMGSQRALRLLTAGCPWVAPGLPLTD
jgi:hypothetical protein